MSTQHESATGGRGQHNVIKQLSQQKEKKN